MQRIYTVNMGSTRAGLSTVGYTLRNQSGGIYQNRTTSGVLELGTSTGIYGVNLTIPDDFVGVLEWDSGEGSPVYAAEDIALGKTEFKITDEVRTLLRAHLNQTIDFLNKKFEKIKPKDVDLSPLSEQIVRSGKEIADKLNKVERMEKPLDMRPVASQIESVKREISSSEQRQQQRLGEFERRLNDIANEAKIVNRILTHDLPKIVGSLRDFIARIPENVRIPNYEQKLSEIERLIRDGMKLYFEMGPESNMVMKNVGQRIQELVQELDPNTIERKRIQREQNGNNTNFLMGVKSWQK